LTHLHDQGYAAAEDWLARQADMVGVASTMEVLHQFRAE
jgi:hypothetical protein